MNKKARTRHLVEGNGGAEKGVDDLWVAIKHLVNQKDEDTHLGECVLAHADWQKIGIN